MDSSDFLAMLGALAQPTRLAAFRAMMNAAPEGVAAGEIARLVGVPHNTLSAHLRVLEASGLAITQRQGRTIRYAADLDQFRALVRFLMQDCCNGRMEICAPVFAELECCS
jgi:ArsR family transcriptional regulator, arsenate/arsenite/antimonite-responsive transcriptional repressor